MHVSTIKDPDKKNIKTLCYNICILYKRIYFT